MAVDAMFWLFMLGNCAFNADLCEMGVGFSTVGFYAPFWFWIFWMKLGITSAWLYIAAVSACGVISHVIIGYFVGRAFQKRLAKWYVSIPVALLCVVTIMLIGNAIGRNSGVFT